ncbi:MAG: glutathione peroxidase [Pyrinomonadaceae bacterium]|nr:glutathione peroxidase [Pyrinomonadaceae bacterium]
MSKTTGLVLLATIGAFIFSIYAFNGDESEASNLPPKETSIYEFTVTNIDGEDVNLRKYKDHVLLFVNTASKCGYTPQYKGLQAIYDKYKDQGFYVLGFPANNFGGQEPGSEKEIKEFCTLRYRVTFPMFAKISVKGDDQHPLYNYLTSKETNPKFGGEVTWNFNKFLANQDGEIIARFSSKEVPESKEVTSAIEKALARNSAK